jgi:hypothetical protein
MPTESSPKDVLFVIEVTEESVFAYIRKTSNFTCTGSVITLQRKQISSRIEPLGTTCICSPLTSWMAQRTNSLPRAPADLRPFQHSTLKNDLAQLLSQTVLVK